MSGPWSQEPPRRPAREPILRAPAVLLLLVASLPVLFILQRRLADGGLSLALFPAEVMDGRPLGLLTSMFLHGDWAHVVMNALGALAFGAPAARLMKGPGGAAVFLLFYMACGVLAGLGYVLLHPGGADPVVGASGAVFGLIGASTRIDRLGGVLPALDRRVLGAAAMWMGLNLLVGLIGLGSGGLGARIAWEAHAAGFLVGWAAIGLVARLFPRRIAMGDDLGEGFG